MNNVGNIRDCFGCGVCATACPTKIIQISLNKNGFYEPRIKNEEKCISCGICREVCSFNHVELAVEECKPLKSWGGWSNDMVTRIKCSSGGIAFELLRQLQNKGFKTIACRYQPEKKNAEHYIPDNEIELIESIGSKYIQSYTVEAFSKIDKKQNYVIIGTPCQIDSLRRMIKRYRFDSKIILIDFFCHGVPSYLAWKSYLKMVEKKIGEVKSVLWRSKIDSGWQDSWVMCLDNKESFLNDYTESKGSSMQMKEHTYTWIKRKSKGDIFYRLFLGDLCMNPACSKNCKYKYDKSSADIRIGDFWGQTYKDSFEGVSSVVAFTETGKDVIESLKEVSLKEFEFKQVAEGQMKKNAHPKITAPLVLYCLKSGLPLDSFPMKTIFFSQKVINKIGSILK